jgi:hypothetical protein
MQDDPKIIEESPVNAIQRTLELNLEYQSQLREQLKRIEQAQQRNNELQVLIKSDPTDQPEKNSASYHTGTN